MISTRSETGDTMAVRFLLVIVIVVATFDLTTAVDCTPNCITRRATCDETIGQCMCSGRYTWGDATFMCYRSNRVAAEVRSDPFLTTYNNETVDFHYPCRYMIGHVEQELKDRDRNIIGTCEFVVHGFNHKYKGKIYVHGFDAAIRLHYEQTTPSWMEDFSMRFYGSTNDGISSEITLGSFLPDGPWGIDAAINYEDLDYGVTVRTYYDSTNNQIVLEANQCGLRVTWVPYNEVLQRNAPNVPGLAVAVNCAHHPRWLSKDITMGLAPKDAGGHLLADIQGAGLDLPESVVVRAFESGIIQNQPYAAPECSSGQSVVRDCDAASLASAMDSCFWTLQQSRFMKCIAPNYQLNNLVELYVDCLRLFCTPVSISFNCNSLVTRITNFGCANVPRIPILTDFTNLQLCPM